MTLSTADIQAWIGKQQQLTDQVCATKMSAMAALLDENKTYQTGEFIAPCWHWLLFNAVHPHSETGHDGHQKKGSFLPPIDLPRRMWAGSKINFIQPLTVGETVTKTATIKDIKFKQSAHNGQLCFVTVEQHISGSSGGLIIELQDIVYKQDKPAATTNNTSSAKSSPQVSPLWSNKVTPDTVMLFKYSALTYNGHKIHYDRNYSTEVEGYPGLLVHGPLTATLITHWFLKHHPEKQVKEFTFKAKQPLFDIAPFFIEASSQQQNRCQLHAKNATGQTAVDAVITF